MSPNYGKEDPHKLNRHPKNKEIYGDIQVEPGFLDSIEREGIKEPVVITPDNVIVSGHRRVEAAKKLGIDEVPVRVEDFGSELAQRAAIVHYNKQRVKIFSQRMREALELEEIERRRADARQGDRTDLVPNFAPSERGNTRDKVAENYDMSGETYRKAKKVWKAAMEEGVERMMKQVEKIDSGEQSIHGAWEEWQRWQEIKDLEGPAEWEDLEEVENYLVFELLELYRKSEDELDPERGWLKNVQHLATKWDEEYGGINPDIDQVHYTFAYLVEKNDCGSIADEISTSPLIDRKPDADALKKLYWDDGLSEANIAIATGVVQELVRLWMLEEDVPLCKNDLPEYVVDALESREKV